jgi:hypothetical protein
MQKNIPTTVDTYIAIFPKDIQESLIKKKPYRNLTLKKVTLNL